MASNQKGFDRRMAVVKDIILSFGLEGTSITPVEYIEHGPFPYNNFIYKVALSSPATAASFTRAVHRVCTVPPPSEGVSSVIVRLSNPLAMGMNNTNRVENEVAAMELARTAVGEIVPGVYAWKAAQGDGSCEEGFGWIVMEYREGEMLDRVFKRMDGAEKKRIVEEVACVFAALQRVKLPEGVSMHGGLTIKNGEIVSGEATLQEGGPGGYVDAWKNRIDGVLKEADESEVIAGWKGSLRQRIETFKNEKLEGVLRDAGIDMSLLGLVHNDFTMNNINYNPQTKRITALLDFDWSSITHPAHEFFQSLHDMHGSIDEDCEKLRTAILTGDFGAGPGENADKEAWEMAEMWDGAVQKYGGKRPCDFKGIQTLYELKKLTDGICPFVLGRDVLVKGWKTGEQNEVVRRGAEEDIGGLLAAWGVVG